MSVKVLLIAVIISLFNTLNVVAQTPKNCTPLSLVGGKGSEIDKTITTPSIPGPCGIKLASDNWNTDWSISNPQMFRSYLARIVSDEGGNFTIKIYLKYGDNSADPFYERNEVELEPKKPLEVKMINRRQEQPYQVNIFVGGVKSLGSQYKATVFGCR